MSYYFSIGDNVLPPTVSFNTDSVGQQIITPKETIIVAGDKTVKSTVIQTDLE